MAELYELNCAYMKMYNRSYRPDGKKADSGDNHDGLLSEIRYVMNNSDDEGYFEELKNIFLYVMTDSWDEEHASYFHCRLENGEFIADRYWKFVDDGTPGGDYVSVDRIEDADEIERYDVTFFYVDAISM